MAIDPDTHGLKELMLLSRLSEPTQAQNQYSEKAVLFGLLHILHPQSHTELKDVNLGSPKL